MDALTLPESIILLTEASIVYLQGVTLLIYLNNFFEVGHELELLNGLHLFNKFEIAFRRSVSRYQTNPEADSLFGGLLANDKPVAFEPYNAFYSETKLYFTPKQPYIREPKQKN